MNLKDKPKSAPVLGFMWNIEQDNLIYKLETVKIDEPFTNRKILSIMQKKFYSIGFTA